MKVGFFIAPDAGLLLSLSWLMVTFATGEISIMQQHNLG